MRTTPDDTSGREALEQLLVLNPMDIDRIPWQPIAGVSGVQHKLLWHLGNFTMTLLHLDPGARTEGAPLLAAHEHIWVVSGAAAIAGHRTIAGSYIHVPPGVRHAITDVSMEGCTLLQMHRPHAPVEAEQLALSQPGADPDSGTPGEGIGTAAAEALLHADRSTAAAVPSRSSSSSS